MAEFKIIKNDPKGNIEKVAITGAKAFYTKFQKPVPIFDQKDMAKPTLFEYTVELLVDEDTADAYDELFPKQTSVKLSKAQVAKKFKLESDEDFKAIGLDPKQKKFYSIKKSQKAQKADGTDISPKLRPRVVEVVDGKPVDVTFDKLVGNGSGVDLLMRVSHNPTYGSFSYPAILKVVNLIEYVGADSSGVDEDTQDFLGGEFEFAEAPESNKGGVEASDEYDEEPPFDLDEDEDDIY